MSSIPPLERTVHLIFPPFGKRDVQCSALKRIPRGRQVPLHPQECISREQALRRYTINNAFLLLDEANRGSLKVGKLADFCIVDRDFLTCSQDELAETQVIATYLGGRRVHYCNFKVERVVSIFLS